MNTQEIPLFLRDYDYTIDENGHVIVNGDLRLFRYDGHSIIHLINIHVKGKVYIDEVETVIIGENVRIDGNLTIFECNELVMPSWPYVGGDVDLHLNDIYAFPKDEIVANGMLWITSSTFFSCALPSKITAYGEVKITDCHGEELKKIEFLKCYDNANISFNNVDIIPNDVFVTKSLRLDNNDNFLLPENIVVLGNLYIRDSNSICGFKNNLNSNAVIGGYIDIRGSSTLMIESLINVCVIHTNNLSLGFLNRYISFDSKVNIKDKFVVTIPSHCDDEKDPISWNLIRNEVKYKSCVRDKNRKTISHELFNYCGDNPALFDVIDPYVDYKFIEEVSIFE